MACEPAPDQRVHLAAHPPPPPPEAHAEPAQGRGDPSRLRHSRGEAPDQPPVVWPPGRGRSEEHTSELQSLMRISYAVFCLKKKKHNATTQYTMYEYRYITLILRHE